MSTSPHPRPTDSASGQGPAAPTGPGETSVNTSSPAPSSARRTWSLVAIGLGAAVIIGTYITVLLTQPATLSTDLGSAALGVMCGYLLGGVLIAAGSLAFIPATTFAMIPVAIALNVVLGEIVGKLPIPLYLDSIGSVLVGVMAGPAAGALTGILSNLIWGLTLGPSTIAFTAGAAFAGAAAGWAARTGAFKRIWTAIIAGLIVGVPAGAIGAPVAAYIYGGGLGVGTGGVVATLQAAGLEVVNATTIQSLASDTIDKALIFLLAFLVLRSLPQRILRKAPYARFSQRGGASSQQAGASQRTAHR